MGGKKMTGGIGRIRWRQIVGMGSGGVGWAVMQQESTGRSLASVSIFGLNGSYTAVANVAKTIATDVRVSMHAHGSAARS